MYIIKEARDFPTNFRMKRNNTFQMRDLKEFKTVVSEYTVDTITTKESDLGYCLEVLSKHYKCI